MIELVYHSHMGRADLAEAAADDWRSSVLPEEPNLNFARTTRFCAAAYRVVGRTDAMRQALLESLQVSKRYGFYSHMFACAERLALDASDAGDIAAAKHWLRVAEDSLPERRVALHLDHSAYLQARIALLSGELELAADRAESFHWSEVLRDPIPRRRAARAAVWLQLAPFVGMDGATEAALFELLRCDFERFKAHGWQDFSAYAIYCAFVRSAGVGEARIHLRRYVERYRRERLPLPVYIQKALAEASATF